MPRRWSRRWPRDAVEPALLRFEAQRLPVGRRIIERARHLGAYLQATRTQEEQARSERHSNAQAVIDGDGGAGFPGGVSRCARLTLHVRRASYSPSSFFALPPTIAAVVDASKPVDTTCSIGSKSAMSNG